MSQIELHGSSAGIYGIAEREIRTTIEGVAKSSPEESIDVEGETDRATEWAWNQYGSIYDGITMTVLFAYDGTWDDLVEAYWTDLAQVAEQKAEAARG